jgi:hypothetical protein
MVRYALHTSQRNRGGKRTRASFTRGRFVGLARDAARQVCCFCTPLVSLANLEYVFAAESPSDLRSSILVPYPRPSIYCSTIANKMIDLVGAAQLMNWACYVNTPSLHIEEGVAIKCPSGLLSAYFLALHFFIMNLLPGAGSWRRNVWTMSCVLHHCVRSLSK